MDATEARRLSSASALRTRPRSAISGVSVPDGAGWSLGARTSIARQPELLSLTRAAESARHTCETRAVSTSFSAMSVPALAWTRTLPWPSTAPQRPSSSAVRVTSGRHPAMLRTSSETVAPAAGRSSAPRTRTSSGEDSA